MRYWLMKSEPSTYSIEDLQSKPNQIDCWEGVRNYQARNFIREMKPNDCAFFYHSNCKTPAIVGMINVVSQPYPDHHALDSASPYFDAKSSDQNNRWSMVDVQYLKTFQSPISLQTLKAHTAFLTPLHLLQTGSRLSIMPISQAQWDFILKLM